MELFLPYFVIFCYIYFLIKPLVNIFFFFLFFTLTNSMTGDICIVVFVHLWESFLEDRSRVYVFLIKIHIASLVS